MRYLCNFVCCTFVFVSFFILPGCGQDTVPIAPDHSLSVDEYISRGVPDPSKIWTPGDYEKSSAVMQSIAAEDTTRLPRYRSSSSGKLFSRIVSLENLEQLDNPSLPVIQRLQTAIEFVPGLRSHLLIYQQQADNGWSFDNEVVEISGVMLVSARSLFALADEFFATLPENDPKMAVRKQGFEQMRSGVVQIVSGALTMLRETHFYRNEARYRMAVHITAELPKLYKRLPHSAQQDILVKLSQLSESETEQNIKTVLNDLKKTVDNL